MSGGMTHQQKLESVDDLAALYPSISDDIIVSCLRERFLSDTIYTAVGSHALVALNPHKYVNSVADSVLMQYASEYRDTERDGARDPHIFQLANNAYYHMRRTTQDQSIVFTYVPLTFAFVRLTDFRFLGRKWRDGEWQVGEQAAGDQVDSRTERV